MFTKSIKHDPSSYFFPPINCSPTNTRRPQHSSLLVIQFPIHTRASPNTYFA